MTNTPRIWAVVPAAGIGARFHSIVPKQYLALGSLTVLEHSISRLLEIDAITKVVVALHAQDNYWQHSSFVNHPKITTTLGGGERYESVLNGLSALTSVADENDWVLVHDAARPCVTREEVLHLITSLEHHAVGGLLGVPVADTLKRVSTTNAIAETVDRNGVWAAHTPQMFRIGLLKNAIEAGLTNGLVMTDEAMAVERFGLAPQMVEGVKENIKITVPQDLIRAGEILKARGIIA